MSIRNDGYIHDIDVRYSPTRFIYPHSTDKDKVTVTVPDGRDLLLIFGNGRHLRIDEDIDISTAELDTGSVSNGKDYNTYACYDNGYVELLNSLAATYPAGYDADTSIKMGGYHTLSENVGTIGGHPLSGYVANEILPNSVWDLKHRAQNLNNIGLTYDTLLNLWLQIYEASDNGASGVQSVYGATILDSIDWNNFVERGAQVGMRLLSDYEFQVAARGSNEETNQTGSSDPVTCNNYVDTAGRRMIAHNGAMGLCGREWSWLLDQSTRFDGAANHTHQITVTGDPQTVTSGNPSGDVAPAWAYYDLPGSKGSIYRQGSYGDVKLLAGGRWANGSYCGSRCRTASDYRWIASSSIGGRFAVEPL